MSPQRHDDPAIEALRGFAALVVVAAHYARFLTPQSGAWGFASTGVDLFFVLSGYVFAPYFFGRQLALGPHLVRRFFRLYPLYMLALLTYAALKMPDPSAWSHFWAHLFMAHTLQSMEIAFFYNPAFWSLPPEVEFYLVLPLLAWALAKWRFGWLFAGALVMHLALAAVTVPGEGATARALATVHLPGLLIEFCLGAWASTLARKHASGGAAAIRLAAGLAWLVAMCVVYATFIAGGRAPQAPGWISGNIGLGAAFGYAVVVSALATRADGLRDWRLRLCLLAGQLSYGVYLFHNAAAHIIERMWTGADGWPAVLASLLLTLLLAFALHHVVEAPARNFGRDLSRRMMRRQPA
jgi:peptidoglycan/LPS O-acetylase OafA/YrhL